MFIKVTQSDIDNGCRQTSLRCPVANALTRILGKQVSVSGRYFRFWFDKEYNHYYLPEDVAKRIILYDLYGEMEPFSFVINI